MSIQFLWEEKYSVGDEGIDAQHKQMLELANSLEDEMSAEDARSTILRLFQHAREHFADEEALMKKVGYPDLESHRKLHEDLITDLTNISARPFDDRAGVLEFRNFVYEWIIDHIMVKDLDYARYVRKSA